MTFYYIVSRHNGTVDDVFRAKCVTVMYFFAYKSKKKKILIKVGNFYQKKKQ